MNISDKNLKYKSIKKVVADNIEYHALKQQYPQDELLDNIYNIIVDVVSSDSTKTIKICDEEKPIETVKNIFMKLNQFHVEYVLKQLRDYKREIKNPKSFTITCLYNSYISSNIGYHGQINYLI